MKLSEINKINTMYEEILHSDLSEDLKTQKFAELMTIMERKYKIPFLRDPEWEKENKAVISLYRKISLSRKL